MYVQFKRYSCSHLILPAKAEGATEYAVGNVAGGAGYYQVDKKFAQSKPLLIIFPDSGHVGSLC